MKKKNAENGIKIVNEYTAPANISARAFVTDNSSTLSTMIMLMLMMMTMMIQWMFLLDLWA